MGFSAHQERSSSLPLTVQSPRRGMRTAARTLTRAAGGAAAVAWEGRGQRVAEVGGHVDDADGEEQGDGNACRGMEGRQRGSLSGRGWVPRGHEADGKQAGRRRCPAAPGLSRSPDA